MAELKIYSIDLGWRGGIVVVAKDVQEACKKMKLCHNFQDAFNYPEEEIPEDFTPNCFEIDEGMMICYTGDM